MMLITDKVQNAIGDFRRYGDFLRQSQIHMGIRKTGTKLFNLINEVTPNFSFGSKDDRIRPLPYKVAN